MDIKQESEQTDSLKTSNKIKFLGARGEVKEKELKNSDEAHLPPNNNLKLYYHKKSKSKLPHANSGIKINQTSEAEFIASQSNISSDESIAEQESDIKIISSKDKKYRSHLLKSPINTWLSQKPIRLVLLSFVFVILTGACLLSLPIASSSGQSHGFFTALFTSTSATCVTGLILLDTMTAWSFFGQLVILILIQIGGLSLLTILSALSLGFKHKITFRTTRALTDGTGSSGLDETLKLVSNIIVITLSIEFLGAIILSSRFLSYMPFKEAIWKGTFQSISAFCNAGFDLMGNFSGKFSSLTAFKHDPIVLLTTSLLIISGGLGFVVWTDIFNLIRKKSVRFHSKIVLLVTFCLLLSGTLFFFFSESIQANKEWLNLSTGEKILNSFFQSTTSRTAGYNSLDQSQLSEAGKWFSSILMLIGAGPASTGGGIKVTTFMLIIAASISDLKGKSDEIHLFKHRINSQLARRSFSLLSFAITLTFALSFLIYFTMPRYLHSDINFSDIFFESTSAFATVGLSSLQTNRLNFISHVGLILAMYIGRVGPASLSLSIIISRSHKATKIYPEGKTFVG